MIPAGATHCAESYGETSWLRAVTWPHLNQVSEEWETRQRVDYWDGYRWLPEHAAFRRTATFRPLTEQERTPSRVAQYPRGTHPSH